MNENWVYLVTVIFRVIGGCAVIGLGAYLLLHGHGVAGGWTMVGGFVIAAISYSSSDDDDE